MYANDFSFLSVETRVLRWRWLRARSQGELQGDAEGHQAAAGGEVDGQVHASRLHRVHRLQRAGQSVRHRHDDRRVH